VFQYEGVLGVVEGHLSLMLPLASQLLAQAANILGHCHVRKLLIQERMLGKSSTDKSWSVRHSKLFLGRNKDTLLFVEYLYCST